MKSKYIIIASVLVICALITYKLVINKKIIDKAKNNSAAVSINIPVQTTLVKDSTLQIEIIKSGQIIPFKESQALVTTPGILKNVSFQLGSHVSKGQVLASVFDETQQLNLQQAKKDAEKSRADLQTYTELLAGKATTQEKVNEMRANYNSAVTNVNVLKQRLADAVIKAPSSGIISAKPIENEMFVSSGTSIATIISLGKTKAQVFLSENEVYQVKNGQRVTITSDVYPNVTFGGVIDFITPQADETKNYQTDILIDNKTFTLLRSGTFVNVNFQGNSLNQAILIPRQAIIGSIKDPSVYIVANGIAKTRKIDVGVEINGLIQVTNGLKKGETIVTSGQINLKEGTKVTVSK